MTITITLPPPIEAQVEAQARAAGVSVQEFLPALISRALPMQTQPMQNGLPLDEWLTLLHNVPSGRPASDITDDDLRRENLYEEHG